MDDLEAEQWPLAGVPMGSPILSLQGEPEGPASPAAALVALEVELEVQLLSRNRYRCAFRGKKS